MLWHTMFRFQDDPSLSYAKELVSELTRVHHVQISKLRDEVAELRGRSAVALPKPTTTISPPMLAVQHPGEGQEGEGRHRFSSQGQLFRESCSPAEEEDAESIEKSQTEGLDASIPEEEAESTKRKDGSGNALKNFWVRNLSASFLGSPTDSQKKKKNEETDSIDFHGLESEVAAQETENEKVLVKRVANIFLGSHFEFAIAILLCFNLLLMAAQLQYHGWRIGHDIGYPRYGMDVARDLPHMEEFFLFGDVIFAVIFTLEMLLGHTLNLHIAFAVIITPLLVEQQIG